MMTKQGRYSPLVLALLAAIVLAISGCVPLAFVTALVSPLELPVSFPSGINVFVSPLETPVSRPAILVEYDEHGEASVWDMPLSAFNEMLGADLSFLSLEPRTIRTLTNGDVRVIHVENQPGGLRFSVNGKSLPSLVWDETAHERLVAMLEEMGPTVEEIAGVVRLMPKLGVGLTIALPGALDSDLESGRLPLLDEDVAADLFTTARAVTPRAKIELSYNEQGQARGTLPPTFFMFGITPNELALPPVLIASFQEHGIERLSILPTGDGLLISFNENELSFISWNDEELERMICLLVPILSDVVSPCPTDPKLLSFIKIVINLPLSIDLTFPS